MRALLSGLPARRLGRQIGHGGDRLGDDRAGRRGVSKRRRVRPAAVLLVGCGKMGGALLDGWIKARVGGPWHVVEPSPRRRIRSARYYAAPDRLPRNLRPAAVVFAVKPQTFDTVLPHYRRFAADGAVMLSIAAGKTLVGMARLLGADAAIVRAMPNTPAAIGRGISVACALAGVTKASRALCGALLGAVGEVAWIEDEALLDPVTAVSGSGPAYVFLLIECMAAAGEAQGLAPDLARRLALATVAGAGELARVATASPAELREAVTSPGGTTRAALDVLMAENGLGQLIRDAVAAATRRSRELAQ
ncbi:MAG: pyrroline-5-carboxylate reductase [Alphaproteobacteria bacterium]|nr:pyrroline-5-carboxylate reductase [Alphaproteobacteria bacterium]